MSSLVGCLDAELVGHLERMPAPSPVLASQPQAPRCSRLSRICRRLLDDVVGLAALEIDDEADAAGIVLELRIVKALGLGCGRVHGIVRCLNFQRIVFHCGGSRNQSSVKAF